MAISDHSDAVILVVDDEDIIRESIATYLEDSGFTVLQANDGRLGLDVFRSSLPDLMLLDLRMPGMDGLDVLAAVTKEYPDTPVIVVTGAGVMKDAVEALRLGAFDFITKPIINMEILEHAVRAGLEWSRLQIENIKYREHLEQEIKARTADLEERTAALETSNQKLKKEMVERQRTEEALRQSESSLADIIALFEGFIYSVTKNFKIEFMNKKLIEHIGRDGTGGLCHEVLYDFDAPCPWCEIQQVIKGQTIRTEIQSPKDGRWYYGIYSPIIDADGAVYKCQSIVMDITERKAAEEALRKSEAQLRQENLRLKSSLKGAIRFGNIIGESKAMHAVYETILKAADSSANVIIYGESGTGKELVAQTIHELSDRSKKKFVTVHCGAIPDNLVESEFFGYKKGAFTGAKTDKPGLLDVANSGTLFMDEVGEINLNMQVKLLRAIEGGGYTPIGSSQVRRSDVRIIAATNRNLKHSVKNGKLRRDFYYRIHIIPIHLPPLRERKEDIPLLIHHFLRLYGDKGKLLSIPEHIMKAMQQYDWPGNVRELQNAVHRYITLRRVDFLDVSPPRIDEPAIMPKTVRAQTDHSLKLAKATEQFEKQYIKQLLEKHRWKRSKVAEVLGISRRTLFRKIKAYDL